jgi:hemerythrin-like metal-binding protein
MEFVVWDEKYTVGDEQLDQQHKRIVNMINLLGEAMEAGKIRPALMKIFTDLAGYTKTHFKAEELFMEQHKYSDVVAHHAQHLELNQKLADYYKNFFLSSIPQTVEVMEFLKHWLYDHILEEDKKFARVIIFESIQLGANGD